MASGWAPDGRLIGRGTVAYMYRRQLEQNPAFGQDGDFSYGLACSSGVTANLMMMMMMAAATARMCALLI